MKLFLDDERVPSDIYGDGANDEWQVVATVEEVYSLLKTGTITHLSLDNDLGMYETEGHKVLPWMIENNYWPSEELYVHSANPYWRKCMQDDIKRYYYEYAKLHIKRKVNDKES